MVVELFVKKQKSKGCNSYLNLMILRGQQHRVELNNSIDYYSLNSFKADN
jgi:hypothetical protein